MNAAVERLLRRRAIVERLIWQARYPVIARQLADMRQAIVAPSFRIVDPMSESELRASWGDR